MTLVLSVAASPSSPLDQSSIAAIWKRFATLALPPSQAAQPDQSTAAATPVRRILVVDDEANVVLTLEAGLSRLSNCRVSTAAGGEQALALLAEQPFDLLITDYKMPGMDGLALAGRARQMRPQMPIVMVTAYSSDELRDQAARLSVYRVLDKPVKITDIRSVADEALRHKR